jgi:MFS transporter, DHA2 family, multidrug resistance protein
MHADPPTANSGQTPGSTAAASAGAPASAAAPAPPAPSQITTHPLLAVLGVLLGALTSVFTGRLLSIGLADMQGAIGAGSDAVSWVSTSYNAGSMFIGPLIVFLGGLLGPRRILLWASVVFMLSEFLSPFVARNVGALIVLQFIAGLSAGTYYPLTMTVIVRNLPLKYVHLGIAAYSLDILASTHIATMVEAWYISNLSWQWIFWNALLTTPLLMACIYWGVPRQPLPPSSSKTNLWGFLYASLALTLIYGGLDQGERLDWFNSGVTNAFLATGVLLTAVAIFRRLRKPNPLLNLRFLATRNFLLLGAVLVLFRFLLLAPTLLLPQFLSVLHGYRPDQTGPVLGWISLIELIAAPIAGYLLYKVDSRLLCALGFMLAGFTCFASSKIDPGWTGETFVATQILNAIGIAFALTGLVTSILRNALALGALQSPANMLSLSCWFQSCRLFGAEIGKTLLQRFLTVRGESHYSVLAQHIDGGSLTEERIKLLVNNLFSGGSGFDDARTRAVLELASSLKQQVVLLAISDGFVLIAASAAVCMLIVGLITYAPPMVSIKKESTA